MKSDRIDHIINYCNFDKGVYILMGISDTKDISGWIIDSAKSVQRCYNMIINLAADTKKKYQIYLSISAGKWECLPVDSKQPLLINVEHL